jgi:hypothetical protein
VVSEEVAEEEVAEVASEVKTRDLNLETSEEAKVAPGRSVAEEDHCLRVLEIQR